MTREYRTFRNDIALPYKWSLGEAWTSFFQGLEENKIMGSKCPQCKMIYVPVGKYCPKCYRETKEIAEVSQEGKIISWTIMTKKYPGQTKEAPYLIALIQLDGTSNYLCHHVGEIDLSEVKAVNEMVKIGSRVRAVWNSKKEGTIFDISHFKIVK
jgi:hypothetical protein